MVVFRATLLLVALGAGLAAATTAELSLPYVVGAKATIPWPCELVLTDPSANPSDIELPQTTGFSLELTSQYGRRSERRADGSTFHQVTVGLRLRVAEAGNHTVPPVVVVLPDGSRLETPPARFEAVGPDPGLRGEAVGLLSFEPSTIIPGQETLLRQTLAFPYQGRYRLAEDWGAELPEGMIELGPQQDQEGFLLDGSGEIWIARRRSQAVTAGRPGTIRIDGQADLFSRGLIPRRIGSVPLRPSALTIAPLPTTGQPSDFAGLVGAVTVTATLERNRIASGEGTRLQVTVRGPQADLLTELDLPEISTVQVYPEGHQAERDDQGLANVFTWQLVPRQPGEFVVPSLSVPYFDPRSGTYERAESSPLALSVLPGRVRTLRLEDLEADGEVHEVGLAEPTWNLPPPLARNDAPGPGPLVVAWGLVIGLGLGLGLGLLARHPPNLGPHRGRALARALERGDLDQANRLVYELLPQVPLAEREALAGPLRQLEQARFGSGGLKPDTRAALRPLEDLA